MLVLARAGVLVSIGASNTGSNQAILERFMGGLDFRLPGFWYFPCRLFIVSVVGVILTVLRTWLQNCQPGSNYNVVLLLYSRMT